MDIKVLVMDVDGTLTDGGIYMGSSGELMKRFNVKDGYGIHDILPKLEIIPVIITGRKSKILEMRCNELGIKHLIQGSSDKVKDLIKVLKELKVSLNETAYIGDDMNDYEVMKIVGIKICPKDAVKEVLEISDYVTLSKGGEGAVREAIEWLKGEKHE